MKLILLKLIISGNVQNPLMITILYQECPTEEVPVLMGESPDTRDMPNRIIDSFHNPLEDCYYGYCGIQTAKDKAGYDELVEMYQEHGWTLYCPRKPRHIPLP